MTRTAARARTGGLGTLAVLCLAWFLTKYHPAAVAAAFDAVEAAASDLFVGSLPGSAP